MISIEDLHKCMGNLAELHCRASSTKDKTLLLEIGYILNKEIDNIIAENTTTSKLDMQKLLADNKQLYDENQRLISALNQMTKMFETTLPSFQKQLLSIRERFDALNGHMNDF